MGGSPDRFFNHHGNYIKGQDESKERRVGGKVPFANPLKSYILRLLRDIGRNQQARGRQLIGSCEIRIVLLAGLFFSGLQASAADTSQNAKSTDNNATALSPASDDFAKGYSYGYRLWEAKSYREAQVHLQNLVETYPSHKDISFAKYLLGRSWLDAGKPATAVKIFYYNYKNEPNGARAPDSLYFLSCALTDLGKLNEAREALELLLKAYPNEANGRLAPLSTAKCKSLKNKATEVDLVDDINSSQNYDEKQYENSITLRESIERAKIKCIDLGFTQGTPKFGDCVLKISE